jgi:hypothetical protein
MGFIIQDYRYPISKRKEISRKAWKTEEYHRRG